MKHHIRLMQKIGNSDFTPIYILPKVIASYERGEKNVMTYVVLDVKEATSDNELINKWILVRETPLQISLLVGAL